LTEIKSSAVIVPAGVKASEARSSPVALTVIRVLFWLSKATPREGGCGKKKEGLTILLVAVLGFGHWFRLMGLSG
jgi:hypothetical protein